jgi:hypothetical protein
MDGGSDEIAEGPDEIWAGDLLGRRVEAEVLIGYIESLLDRPRPNSQSQAYTLQSMGITERVRHSS